jgi:hypothetical protein
VGAIRAWMAGPEPREPDTFTALLEMLVPRWWLQPLT